MSKASEYAEALKRRPEWASTHNGGPLTRAQSDEDGALRIYTPSYHVRIEPADIPGFLKWVDENFIDHPQPK